MTAASSSAELRAPSEGWVEASAHLDAVRAALFEGRYLEALHLARRAAAQMRDTVGPDHPAHAELDALLNRRRRRDRDQN